MAVDYLLYQNYFRFRLLSITPNLVKFFAVDCVEHEPLIENSSSCMKLVNAAKTHHLIPDWSVDIAPHEFQSRSLHKEAKIYLVGGEVHQKVNNQNKLNFPQTFA